MFVLAPVPIVTKKVTSSIVIGSAATPKTLPKTVYGNQIMDKINKDLNSPSAAARIRAKKALKSPNFRNLVYGQFDVPHERQDIITAAEREPLKPKTVKEIFADCKIYVEVRTGDDNRSAGIKNRLLRDGITVNEKMYKDTTHVIFKDGLLSTFKNAVKLGIPVTTILWIESCVSLKRLVDPAKFKISNLDRYERPELYKRMRRQKSMQPEVSKLVVTQNIKALTQEESQKHFDDESNIESDDTEIASAGMDLTLQNEQSLSETLCEQTLCKSTEAMEIVSTDKRLDKWNRNFRRFTTFTPNPMDQTGSLTKSAVAPRRRTILATQLSGDSDNALATPEPNGFSANSSNTVVFNSTNKISKASRRSVFDISMNILELNCKAISEKNEKLLTSAKKVNPALIPTSHEKQTPTQTAKPAVIRKRKLFNNDDLDEIDECKENHDDSVKKVEKKVKPRKSLMLTFNTPQLSAKPKTDRRRTLSYFKTDKPKEDIQRKTTTPVKPIASLKRIVCTNMSSSDKLIIQAVSKNT